MGRVRHYKLTTLAGLILSFTALCVLAATVANAGLLTIEALLVTAGFGTGTLFPTATNCVQNAVELSNLGVATAILAFLRQLGSAIGVAVLGAVLLHGTGMSLVEGVGASLVDGGAGSADVANAFAFVFIGAAVCALAALVCFLLMEEKPLRSTTGHERAPVPVQRD
jgi:MFS family permease